MDNAEKLQSWLKNELTKHRNPYHMARSLGVSHGLVYRALDGHDSPILRRVLGINRKRTRLIIECCPETIARFDTQRGEITRAAWLEELLDKADGIGDVV